jgi:hypothetical protein
MCYTKRKRDTNTEGIAVKVQDFAYQVAMRTIELLEETQHYKIPENLRKEVGQKILTEVDTIIKQTS